MSSKKPQVVQKLNLQKEEEQQLTTHDAPIVASFNDRIRPLPDAVDKLRHLKIMQEGIQLPTIVAVGDQSSGKSSVLESLAGICLPRGQGICTRVPLIMRLQNHTNPEPELSVEFNGKTVPTDEANVATEIINCTQEIAGKGKGISHTALTLIVKKKGVPDLTMIDLPGITRVPVHGQPENIYEQISKIIMEYITPEESIILNVVSAGVDFSTCESIRMSQQVDKTGQRTLAVVTKADKSPEGLLEKVTADDVNVDELNKMPKHLSSIGEAMAALMHSLGCARESLKIMLHGEFDEYLDETDMHATAKIAEMLTKYSKELQSAKSGSKDKFLADEMKVLEECRSIGLPNFIPKSAFRTMLAKKVKGISGTPFDYVEKIWCYVEIVVTSVLLQHCDNYPQLIPCTRRAAQTLIARKQQQSIDWISNTIEMEKLTDYTCNPEYTASWTNLMSKRAEFMRYVKESKESVKTGTFGEVNVVHLWKVNAEVIEAAYDLKIRMASYWDIVTRRIVDNTVLHLMFSIQNLINKEMEKEIVTELMGTQPQGNGLEKMLKEQPSVAEKRKKLQNSISLLKESKDVVANIIDTVAI